MSEIAALDRLRVFLKPAGKGIPIFSTGAGYAATLHRMLYKTDVPSEVEVQWEESLLKVSRATHILFGVPSDTGAGILRGANFGPIGVREAYLNRYGGYPKGLVDVGDVISIPHFLHDEMLNEAQLAASRKELFPQYKNTTLPVSPLSIAEETLRAIYELNPTAMILLIGGDHSVSWPAMKYCALRSGNRFGVLHFDAHTDLMESRMGVKYCFATWAFHGHQLAKPQHFVQVGIRTSGKDKDYWTHKYPITQIWAREIPGNETSVIQKIVKHFTDLGVEDLYISNDIDATDSPSAPATGTPEANGLTPAFIDSLIREVKSKFKVIGADIVEVAPPLSGSSDFKCEKTCLLAANYLHTTFSGSPT